MVNSFLIVKLFFDTNLKLKVHTLLSGNPLWQGIMDENGNLMVKLSFSLSLRREREGVRVELRTYPPHLHPLPRGEEI